MEIGKVPNNILKDIILGKLVNNRSEILVRPGIGEDCCVVDFGEYSCVMSSDPITGTANDVGRLAVHVTCNDIAACGVEPLGLIVTILAPPGTMEYELETIMDQLIKASSSINVDIMGGHTEITSAVTRFVIICTAVGKVLKDKAVTTGGAKTGDCLVLTKSAGIEGTAIIAFEKEKELLIQFGAELVKEAKNFMESISVVREGIIAAEFGVSAMHDVTEGGVLGAVWEMCEASGTGAEIYSSSIPISVSTERICEYYGIDPLRLISSGSMLIAAEDGEGLVRKLKEENINASIIGKLVQSGRKIYYNGKEPVNILQPESDELYKVCGR
jgi:hydrogenase maturation factor